MEPLTCQETHRRVHLGRSHTFHPVKSPLPDRKRCGNMLLFSTMDAKGCSHFNKWNILTHFSHPSSHRHTGLNVCALCQLCPSNEWQRSTEWSNSLSWLALILTVPSFNPSIYHISVILSSLCFSHGMCLRLRETPHFWHQHRSEADGSNTRLLIWCHGHCSTWHHYKKRGHIPWHMEPEHICTGGQHPDMT